MENLTVSNILMQIFFALFACAGYAIIANAPRKEIPFCGLNGLLSWLVYLLVYIHTPSPAIATLIAAMVVTAFARFISYHREAPSILYHMPGVFPLVPGAAIYNTLSAAINGMSPETYAHALHGMKLAGAISIGSLLILVLPSKLFEIIPRSEKKNA